ncbi:23S rRNA (adenine(2503)-C(2))-methyltransferase RlmN [Cuneatibacter sp. NSJ-177]|uniref:23S rRNA (adenine(2503)-C(2))-methyltransferase RlmN n=1 Tax=Cuneatibacter sp. NSJ-177 TaxID=2931401 RepID=UPI001FD4BD24|nr:23S rRNA (adenine(2503)-C(2))-methyltransferase RlmN [Cuneatibacter sp. NSJ-177]MCJ7834329.1 23S rRNA (adenine(2503)-C(2))-methyltransferase RlmN [Cuneatibacter sp. NSJ-177]
MKKIDLKSMELPEIKTLFGEMGEKPFRAGQLYSWIHQKKATEFQQMTNLSEDLRRRLAETCELSAFQIADRQISKLDGTRKYAFLLSDGNIIESVYMKYRHGISVCISSQAGCRMGCRFCASTLDGLARNLTAGEMLEQIDAIERDAGERVSHVVVMGSGEPLDNKENLIRFLHLVSDENGGGISQRNITVSTCGLVPEIRELAGEKFAITLALSLHAPNDALRRTMMPIANRYTIAETLKACDFYFEQTGRRMSYEYSLVRGVNDRPEHARELTGLLKGKNCHVNLIPVNPIKEREYRETMAPDVDRFKKELEKSGINVTIRRRLGADIDSACGQLRRRIQRGEVRKEAE